MFMNELRVKFQNKPKLNKIKNNVDLNYYSIQVIIPIL